MKQLLIFSVIASIAMASCNVIDGQRVKGNGKIITKTYDFTNFNAIDIGNASAVFLKQDSVFNVRIETDENLLPYIETNIEDGELNIYEKNDYNLDASNAIKIYISMPTVSKISISGAATIKGENKIIQNNPLFLDLSGASDGALDVKAPGVNIEVSGASTLNITGETKDVKGEISGASTLKSFDLKSENNDMEASGASTANVFASVNLTADASGASSIHYKGDPKVSSSANGAGSVKKED